MRDDPRMGDSESSYRTASIIDDATVPIEDGTMQWIPLRRRLGVHGFGTNAYRAARAGDRVIEEHVESPGQEEMYVVVAGGVSFEIEGEQVEAATGTVVFLPRPEVRRGAVATEDDTVVLAVGGWPGKPYHSLPWEPIYLASEAMRRGDWAAAVDTLEREAGEYRAHPFVRYHMACALAGLGEHDAALKELREAVNRNDTLRERAATDERLAALRDREDWPG
jgi:quercetin dioxygenase-like cupin family protein